MKIYSCSEIKQLIAAQKNPHMETAPKKVEIKEGDKVDFSTQLQQVQGMEENLFPNTDRQTRLQEVKAQIAEGTYSPDLKKVAMSLLKYILKSNKNG